MLLDFASSEDCWTAGVWPIWLLQRWSCFTPKKQRNDARLFWIWRPTHCEYQPIALFHLICNLLNAEGTDGPFLHLTKHPQRTWLSFLVCSESCRFGSVLCGCAWFGSKERRIGIVNGFQGANLRLSMTGMCVEAAWCWMHTMRHLGNLGYTQRTKGCFIFNCKVRVFFYVTSFCTRFFKSLLPSFEHQVQTVNHQNWIRLIQTYNGVYIIVYNIIYIYVYIYIYIYIYVNICSMHVPT